MTVNRTKRQFSLGTALAALAIGLGSIAVASPAAAQPTAARPSETLNLSAGTGTLVRLSEPMSDVFIAKDSIADIQVRDRTWQHRNDKWIVVCVDRLHKEHWLLTGIDCEYQADYIADAIRKAWKAHEASVRDDTRNDGRMPG